MPKADWAAARPLTRLDTSGTAPEARPGARQAGRTRQSRSPFPCRRRSSRERGVWVVYGQMTHAGDKGRRVQMGTSAEHRHQSSHVQRAPGRGAAPRPARSRESNTSPPPTALHGRAHRRSRRSPGWWPVTITHGAFRRAQVRPKELKTGAETDTCTRVFTAPFPTGSNPSARRQTDGWTNCGPSHTAEYYSAMARRGVLAHAAACVNLINTMVTHRSQTRKATHRWVPFTRNCPEQRGDQRLPGAGGGEQC